MANYLVLDGHSLAFRAWFALQEAGMRTASGQETQAVYGFVSMVTKLLDDFKPDGMAVAFDRREPTFRDSIVEDYKGGRPPTPEPLVQQLELIRKFVTALGVPAVDAVGYEADDVLGTLAKTLAAGGDDVIIVTGDRDTYQLVEDPHTKVLYNRRGVSDYVLYDEAGILERTGVVPRQYPLLAALRGDSSDNIAGVPGVGDKTAARLVNDYGDIDAIFANVEKCTPKLRASLEANENQVRRNFLLTPIVCDVPLEVQPADLAFAATDRAELTGLLDLLELRTLKDRLFATLDARALSAPGSDDGALVDGGGAPPQRPVRVLDDADPAVAYLTEIDESTRDGGSFAIEAAWSAIPGRSAIEGVALLSLEGDDIGYLTGDLVGEPSVLAALARLVTSPVAPLVATETPEGASLGMHRMVGHRTKELMRALLALGVDCTDLAFDTAVAAYLIDPALGQATLEDLARRSGLTLGGGAATSDHEQLGFDLAGGAADGEAVRVASLARRTEVVAHLAEILDREVEAVGGRKLWEQVERPLVRVLAKMEVVGIGVDIERLREINSELTAETKRLESEIHALAGESFNLNSPPQLRVVLYEKLGLRPQRKTKTGYSTDAQTLEKLRGEHEIIDALLAYREVEKLRSTYGSGLLAEVAPDGRIHASFNQTVARTGRLSSDAPNLHNIPVRSEGGRRFRTAFVPTDGREFLVADYNQIELRVIAHLSGDPGLVGAFDEGRDIHATTAAGVFSVDPSEVTGQMRAKAKMVSYGLAYGMEAYGLAQRLGIEVSEAAQILDRYFEAFPSVQAYMDGTVTEAKRRGYTETEYGRRRYLPELTSDNFRVRQAAERQAMNAGIQGLAADIFKLALVRLDAELESARLKSRIVLQVHDEILVEVEPDERDQVRALTLDAMQSAYPLKVPLEVNIAWGKSWADAKPA